MLFSLGLLFLVGLSMAYICQKIKLPRILGMLFSGIILGPYVLDLLDPTLLNISAELRQIALIIILIKAGLSLNIADLKRVGRPAMLMSFVPAMFEIFAYLLFAPVLLVVSHADALLMGAVLAAVSPAIVVPRMVNLIEKGYGTKKSIPQMILASASIDDVFVIVLFTSFLAIAGGSALNAGLILNIPLSIVFGIIFGGVIGFLLSKFFNCCGKRGKNIRNSIKVLIILGISFLVIAVENLALIPFSGLPAVLSMACVLKLRSKSEVASGLSEKFGKLWIAAEIMLFVLVGATVDINYLLAAGGLALLMIIIGLLFRSAGVLLCLLKTDLNKKERLFCVLAYLPKATVQAAIGATPLAVGLASGNIILCVAVMAIVITAPLGAIATDATYKKLLEKEEQSVK